MDRSNENAHLNHKKRYNELYD